jgi:hypothetical protein
MNVNEVNIDTGALVQKHEMNTDYPVPSLLLLEGIVVRGNKAVVWNYPGNIGK